MNLKEIFKVNKQKLIFILVTSILLEILVVKFNFFLIGPKMNLLFEATIALISLIILVLLIYFISVVYFLVKRILKKN